MTHDQARPLLAAHAAGTLAADDATRVAAHVVHCRTCARELEEWRLLRSALAATLAPAPRGPLEAARLRVAAAHRPSLPRRFASLLRAEAPLVRRQIWAASLLVLVLGVPVTLSGGAIGGSYLAVIAPLVAAAGVAFLYGPAADPPLELALSTPTSPRLVLLARLTLVFGFDLALALGVSALLAVLGAAPGGMGALVVRWLGPMLLLSALSLSVALRAGPATGMSVSLGLWAALVFLGPALDRELYGAATLLQSTNLLTVGLAVGMGAGLLAAMPRSVRLPA
jgi:hypothetical protein